MVTAWTRIAMPGRSKQTGPLRPGTSKQTGPKKPGVIIKRPPANGGLKDEARATARPARNKDARMKALFVSSMESIALGVATEQDHASAIASMLYMHTEGRAGSLLEADAPVMVPKLVLAAVEASRAANHQRAQR